MRPCYVCNRELSTPFNLRRHMKLCHNIASPLRVGKTKTVGSQHGRGGGNGYQADEEIGSIADSVDSGTSEFSVDSSICDVSESKDNDQEREATDDADASENGEFRRFFDDIDRDRKVVGEVEDLTFKQRKKLFVTYYGDFLVWYHNLKQNTIHKKIIETAKELKDGPGEYDKEESLRAAVEQRTFLLARIVEEYTSDGTKDVSESPVDSDDDYDGQ